MFNLAKLWGIRPDGSNPCLHVKRYKDEKRERFLSQDEFARLGTVLDEIEHDGSETRSAVAAIRLLMLTGCRRTEIRTLRWEHVDLDAGELHLPDTKTGTRVVPLAPAAVNVLAALPRDHDNPWVISGKKPGSHLTDLNHPWCRIRDRAGLHDVRLHDLSHAYASRTLAPGEILVPTIRDHRRTGGHVEFPIGFKSGKWGCRVREIRGHNRCGAHTRTRRTAVPSGISMIRVHLLANAVYLVYCEEEPLSEKSHGRRHDQPQKPRQS